MSSRQMNQEKGPNGITNTRANRFKSKDANSTKKREKTPFPLKNPYSNQKNKITNPLLNTSKRKSVLYELKRQNSEVVDLAKLDVGKKSFKSSNFSNLNKNQTYPKSQNLTGN